ncbi:transposase [Desulfobulbus elongatus]|uniref:transposase n=1 Tax=Desulfobulbus elongatus TaxID=53332 RepID=UPI003CCC23F7
MKDSCVQALVAVRWPSGYQCLVCGGTKASPLASRHLCQCAPNIPLVKWFWAISLTASDKGGLSALRASKHLGVSSITARTVQRKIRHAMAHRDSIHRLANLIGRDDTVVGGR